MEKPTYVLEAFEGPLDLLLHLLQKNKVSIYDIPIFEISKQYLEYLEQMKELDLEVTSEFVVMASQLLYIKSRMLLPQNPEIPEEDPRAELVEKLLEYSKYKAASHYLMERGEYGRFLFFKKPDRPQNTKVENQFDDVTAQDLFELVRMLLQSKKDSVILPQKSFGKIVARETVSVQSKIEELLKILSEQQSCGFLDIFKKLPSRPHIVAMFLGVLELLKQNRIEIRSRKRPVIYLKAE